MKKKTVLLTLISMFLLSAMVLTSVVAQPRIVGVAVGDWFTYGDITGSWSSNDPNATYSFLELNYTEWMRISVENVSGTNITLQSTWHFTNGTEKTESGHIDIDTGEGNMTLSAISADLDANDMRARRVSMDRIFTSLICDPQKMRFNCHLLFGIPYVLIMLHGVSRLV